MLVYPAGLDVSSHDLDLLTRALRAHRVRIGTPWRALSAREQALLVLAYLRKNETLPRPGRRLWDRGRAPCTATSTKH